MISPAVVIGDNASKAAVAVAAPVPPSAIANCAAAVIALVPFPFKTPVRVVAPVPPSATVTVAPAVIALAPLPFRIPVRVVAPVPPLPTARVPVRLANAPAPIKSQVVAFHRYIAKPLDSMNSQPAGRLVQVPPVLSAVVPLMILPTWYVMVISLDLHLYDCTV